MQHRPSCQLTAALLVTGPYLRLITVFTSVISGFHREVNKNWALLGYFAASSGN